MNKIEEFRNFPFDEYVSMKASKRRRMTDSIKNTARNPLNTPEVRYAAYEALLEVKQKMYELVDKEKNEFDSVCCQIRNLVKDKLNISDDILDLNLKIRDLQAQVDKKDRIIQALTKKKDKQSVDELIKEVECVLGD